MKIGCDACGRAEAAVLCCADEAALCRRCDAAVHSANKLAGRHHRVALLPPASSCPAPVPPHADAAGDGAGGHHHPVCDICQEKAGYFFCLEDRALLCRPCDVAVHAAAGSVLASAHRRFLLTGVRIGDDHHDIPCNKEDGGALGSPSSSSANSGFLPPTSSGSDPTSVSDNNVRSTPLPVEERWLWTEILADDDGGM